ncbi:hypothetical protein [Mucilaginibacter lappiensis]|uniref:Uncharacterized protein n=1 Tax=Mucilaginibacter lappiensis TaxID=354630 RepID=A0A841J8U8_9SPHI|nr:hypothetical protein [Mucilaginibacter lappiensis]MBB6126782.1 hypothetical protein [Mucilaginibacter lappiensis]
MFEEFLLLLESEKGKIETVLKPHLDEKIFKQLVGGFFDETQKRFIAFAFMPIKRSMFYEYDYLFELSTSGHSAIYFSAEIREKKKNYIDQNTFQYKSIQELIEEGIYKSLLIIYTGEFDFNEWNILRSCCFSDTKDKNKMLQSRLDWIKENTLKDYFFSKDTIFQEALEHHTKLMSYVQTKNEAITIPSELKPFVGHSNLVALVRAEKKQKLNLAFQDYIKKAVYHPLIISLKTNYPDIYETVWGFYGNDCNFLTPSHRQFCLMLFMATYKRKKSLLQFYFYHLQENKLYKWIYFELHPYKEKFDYDLIQRVFSPISKLDNMDYIHDPRCNFDDDDFWNNFVLKKNNGEYQYLIEYKATISTP